MSRIPVIALFDIGKTNKKFFLYDEAYRIVHETCVQLVETTDEDGFPTEDIAALTAWCRETFNRAEQLPQLCIRAINCSAYGASLVHLDDAGHPVTPLYNYLKPYPAALQSDLYERYGGADQVSAATASPVLGSLNAGMQLYRIRKMQPQVFERIYISLHLPQYISYLFSGKYHADITSIGCHTALWDFAKGEYHRWVKDENLLEKLPPVFPGAQTDTVMLHGRTVVCGGGLHDSSAALIPYLLTFSTPFVLISTGTWCISLNPFNTSPLTQDELAQDCLCYLTYKGVPVKASRLFAGQQHETAVKELAAFYAVEEDHYKKVSFDRATWEHIRRSGKTFDTATLAVYANYREAYHALMNDIISRQQRSVSLVLSDNTSRIYVDGGFAQNTLFMHMLAATFSSMEVFAAEVSQATALGAALAVHDAWNTQPLPDALVALKCYTSRK